MKLLVWILSANLGSLSRFVIIVTSLGAITEESRRTDSRHWTGRQGNEIPCSWHRPIQTSYGVEVLKTVPKPQTSEVSSDSTLIGWLRYSSILPSIFSPESRSPDGFGADLCFRRLARTSDSSSGFQGDDPYLRWWPGGEVGCLGLKTGR